jgi:hypothetical protein
MTDSKIIRKMLITIRMIIIKIITLALTIIDAFLRCIFSQMIPQGSISH